MASKATEESFSVKLIIDEKRSKVLYAEAGKDFVDFLFCLLSLPLGEIVNLLGKEGLMGSSGNVYKSLANLDDSFLVLPENEYPVKPELLHPAYPSIFPTGGLKLQQEDSVRSTKLKYYLCPICTRASTAINGNRTCSHCRTYCREIRTVENFSLIDGLISTKEGVVKDVVKYIISDDLVITPIDTTSMLPLMKRLITGDISALEERTVMVGVIEGKAILRALFCSKSVFTDLFLAAGPKCPTGLVDTESPKP